jgi:Peptidase inhibitor I78 family
VATAARVLISVLPVILFRFRPEPTFCERRSGSKKQDGAMRHIFPLAAGIALLGCTMTAPPPVKTIPAGCGAEGLQTLVGQPESVLAAMTFPTPVRIIHPGDAVTMDFSPARLNITVDRNGRIDRVYCG